MSCYMCWYCCGCHVIWVSVIRKRWSRRSEALRSECQRYSKCWVTWRSSSTPSLVTTLTWRQTKAEQWNGHWQLPRRGLFFFLSALVSDPQSVCQTKTSSRTPHERLRFAAFGFCLHSRDVSVFSLDSANKQIHEDNRGKDLESK